MKVKLDSAELELWSEDYNALAKFVNFIIPWIVDKSWIKKDEAKFERWENAQKLMIKAKKIIDDSQKEIKKPPLKISTPLLENASLENEEDLQNKWANLLANSLTWEKNITPAYIEILKELSTLEVHILDKIYNDAILSNENITDVQFWTDKVCELFKINIEEWRLIVDNFFRLRLAEAPAVQWIKMWDFSPVWKTNDFFQMTTLWYKFIEACKFND